MKSRILVTFFTCLMPFFSLGSTTSDSIFTFFTANQTSEGVLIAFTIKGGITCQGVKIMNSTDGVNFHEIYEIPGICGNTNYDESYKYTDTSPTQNRINYYRVDLGTLGIYSDILSVLYIGYNSDGYKIFPNPCTLDCNVYFSNVNEELHQYVIYDTQGNFVVTGETTDNSFSIDENSLKAGIYLFQVYRRSEPIFSGRLLHIK